jgi:hypothetical protein
MLEVRFGSYAMGIDRRAAARVEALVAAEKAATHVSRSGQGREGEYALCVAAKTPAALAPLARRIRSALPKQPVGPIAISYGVRKFQALKDRRERHRDS